MVTGKKEKFFNEIDSARPGNLSILCIRKKTGKKEYSAFLYELWVNVVKNITIPIERGDTREKGGREETEK